MSQTTLIFPAGMVAALAYRDRAEAEGRRIIGASSIAEDPARAAYGAWEFLPYLTSAGFEPALIEVLNRHGVSEIFTPHFVVHKWLADNLPRLAPGVRLHGADGPEQFEQAYRALSERIQQRPANDLESLPSRRPDLTHLQRAGLVRLVGTVPGMCSEEKMHLVIEVMRRAPPGDIVEIGSWWGRSAVLFAWLSHHYALGKLLCIDPWRKDAMVQGDAFLDSTSANLDTDEALRMFEINLAPVAFGQVNYHRARSVDGALVYESRRQVTTEAFGTTSYEGQIAVLHIDGNHAYEEVAQDEAAWTKHVAPGGWIIFDDYVWAFGDGPKRVADDFVARRAGDIDVAVSAGASLYVKLKGPPG